MEKSTRRADNFAVTDMTHEVKVAYKGIMPDLFREGQGAWSRVNGCRTFHADEVLAKHDENHMPPEVAEALRKSGKWKGGVDK